MSAFAPSRPFFIGVAGGTCSGKTTFAERLATIVGGENAALIRLDAYELARTSMDFRQRADSNHDVPDAFEWDLLNDHLGALASGGSVESPVYDYKMHTRSAETRLVPPAAIVIVEGILALHDPALRQRFDLKIFVDTPADVRFIRRLERDVSDRGRTTETIVRQYLATVRPSHERFVEPSKQHADLILLNGGLNETVLDLLLARIREFIPRNSSLPS